MIKTEFAILTYLEKTLKNSDCHDKRSNRLESASHSSYVTELHNMYQLLSSEKHLSNIDPEVYISTEEVDIFYETMVEDISIWLK